MGNAKGVAKKKSLTEKRWKLFRNRVIMMMKIVEDEDEKDELKEWRWERRNGNEENFRLRLRKRLFIARYSSEVAFCLISLVLLYFRWWARPTYHLKVSSSMLLTAFIHHLLQSSHLISTKFNDSSANFLLFFLPFYFLFPFQLFVLFLDFINITTKYSFIVIESSCN